MMEKNNKTTNFKADTILDVIQTLNDLKKSGEIQFVNYKWDEKNNVFDIYITPKQVIKTIKCNFILCPSGITFQ